MRGLQSGIGVIGAVMPILYCGGLALYFLDFSGSLQQAQADGLGPTVLGLCGGGVLFSIPLLIRIIRLFSPPSPPRPSRRDAPEPPEVTVDADAMVARYKARQAAETAPRPRPSPRPPQKPGFGRKTR